MKWPVRLNQSRWWRGFWLCWFTGSGIYDLTAHQWAFVLIQAAFMAVIVMLWMSIDRNMSR